MSDLSEARRSTSSWWKRCPSAMKKVILAGEVGPRSRMFSPSSRAIDFMNSPKPVERRCTRSPETTPSSEPCWPEPPKILLNMLGDTGLHCKGSVTRVPNFLAFNGIRYWIWSNGCDQWRGLGAIKKRDANRASRENPGRESELLRFEQ